MSTRRRTHIVPTVIGALALSVLPAAPAFADGSHEPVLRAHLVGSQLLGRPTATPVIAGKIPGGTPWSTDPGSRVRVRQDGRIDVRLRGLVVTEGPFAGTNPPAVAAAVATLVCGNQVVDSTAPFPLDRAGDGRTRDVLAVPAMCSHPVVIIQPNAATSAVYIAYTPDDDEDDD